MNEQLVIRLAMAKDAEGIALESMAEIEHNLDWSWPPQRVRKAISDPETNVAVATEDGAMIAFGIMEYKNDEAHLLLFAVREDARRRGVGSTLLQWLEHVAHVAGVMRFKVEAREDNAPARAFYRRHGYLETETVPQMYHPTVHGVRFEKVADLAERQA